MTIEDFQYKVSCANDETRIDELCIYWLKDLANDHGKDGEIAKDLLKCVKTLLEIY